MLLPREPARGRETPFAGMLHGAQTQSSAMPEQCRSQAMAHRLHGTTGEPLALGMRKGQGTGSTQGRNRSEASLPLCPHWPELERPTWRGANPGQSWMHTGHVWANSYPALIHGYRCHKDTPGQETHCQAPRNSHGQSQPPERLRAGGASGYQHPTLPRNSPSPTGPELLLPTSDRAGRPGRGQSPQQQHFISTILLAHFCRGARCLG